MSDIWGNEENRDVWGNTQTNSQGNPQDQDVFGNQPRNIHGNYTPDVSESNDAGSSLWDTIKNIFG